MTYFRFRCLYIILILNQYWHILVGKYWDILTCVVTVTGWHHHDVLGVETVGQHQAADPANQVHQGSNEWGCEAKHVKTTDYWLPVEPEDCECKARHPCQTQHQHHWYFITMCRYQMVLRIKITSSHYVDKVEDQIKSINWQGSGSCNAYNL